MNEVDYRAILHNAVVKLSQTLSKRNELEAEAAKLKQFIHATLNMVSDDERASFLSQLNEIYKANDAKINSLAEAIRRVLQASPEKWFTVAQMRDRISASGFDLSNYTASPLASISTTLKRMHPKEVMTTEIEGVTAYRWITRFPRKAHAPKRNRAMSLSNL
ncbi:MAG TPA: hypothetical protein VIY69_18440 [Candidatus Acidoferrales bacterium]